jgi:hypothetical protein
MRLVLIKQASKRFAPIVDRVEVAFASLFDVRRCPGEMCDKARISSRRSTYEKLLKRSSVRRSCAAIALEAINILVLLIILPVVASIYAERNGDGPATDQFV